MWCLRVRNFNLDYCHIIQHCYTNIITMLGYNTYFLISLTVSHFLLTNFIKPRNTHIPAQTYSCGSFKGNYKAVQI
jgi:hypothetical protein